MVAGGSPLVVGADLAGQHMSHPIARYEDVVEVKASFLAMPEVVRRLCLGSVHFCIEVVVGAGQTSLGQQLNNGRVFLLSAPWIEDRIAVEVAADHRRKIFRKPLGMPHDGVVNLPDVVLFPYSAYRARPDGKKQKVARAPHTNGRNPLLTKLILMKKFLKRLAPRVSRLLETLSRAARCFKSPRFCGEHAQSFMFVFAPPARIEAIVLAQEHRLAGALGNDGDVGPKLVEKLALLRQCHAAIPNHESH